MDIFANKRLHPKHDTLVKHHYKDYFDTVFIAFSPFFKIKNDNYLQEGHQKSSQVTFEKAQQANGLFQKMPKPNADIYSYNNEKYPEDKEIYEQGQQVSWREIKDCAGFENFGDINKALKTSIGAYKKVFQRPDLAEKLSDFTSAHKIYFPTEGHFEVLSKKQTFKAFQLLKKTQLIIEDEFCENRKELDIASRTEKEFVEAVNFNDYFIYDKDKKLLFAVDWDDFFFLICSNQKYVQTIVNTLNVEGFYCNDITVTEWEM